MHDPRRGFAHWPFDFSPGAIHFFNMFMIAKFGKTDICWVSVREHGEKVADSGVAPTSRLRNAT